MLKELYLIPAAVYIFSYIPLLFKEKKMYRVFISLIYAGFAVQTIIFFIFLGVKGLAAPVHIDWFVFFNAWLLMAIVVLFSIFYKVEYILLYITPLVAINLLVGFFVPHVRIKPLMLNVDKAILLTHIILILIGDSLFALAFIVSLIYIFQERKIKNKKNLKLFDKKELPAHERFYAQAQAEQNLYSSRGYNLELLDSINYQCLKIGFPFITIGIVMGIYMSSSLFKTFIIVKPIEIMSLITWLIYAILLHERIAKGLRGKKAAIFGVIGFLLIIFSLSFSFYLFPAFHGFK
ncbi:MAG: cytochrome c biogenesis protein CcsA [bacterium]